MGILRIDINTRKTLLIKTFYNLTQFSNNMTHGIYDNLGIIFPNLTVR